jgi:Leucine-rich repeat (LRR) protein
LSGNRLTAISPEAFEGLSRLETLRLEFNRLSAIPLEALARLPGEKDE